jgi:hypothetical protein
MFKGNAAGLSVAIRYGASKSYAPACSLATYHQILFELLTRNLGDLLFDQVISMLYLVSRILAQSTKI